MRKIIIGVMGPGENATPTDIENAYQLGKSIAEQGWVLLTGGRNVGVMEAASQGAKQNNGLTIGILPGNNSKGMSEAVDIAIFTDIHNARNNINVLSSDVVIACGMGLGTASEVALALKNKKPVILLTDSESQAFFQKMAPVYLADNVDTALSTIKNIVGAG
ncbi:MAG: TIGR00725 family protein [Calothrix sp. FI2-JRJ7]|jgi:hypothetical protein|nr:TIGR00725 family protein [Calothrix sp. FI2-JRJ7]